MVKMGMEDGGFELGEVAISEPLLSEQSLPRVPKANESTFIFV